MKNQFTYFNFFKTIIFIIIIYSLAAAQSKISETCPEGIISYWKFDEFGDVNIFLDSYGGYNASCDNPANCPSEDSGIVNNARRFNGSDEVTVPDNNAYDWGPNTSFTIEAWIKTTQPGTGNRVFVGKYQGGSQMSWWLGYGDNNKPIFSVRDSAGIKSEIEGETIINDGNWHHIAGVRNNSLQVLQIFVDGEEDNILSTFFTGDFSGSSPINIGHYVNDFYYTGLLDEIAVYDRGLTKDQISSHYNNGLQNKPYCDQFTDIENENGIPNEYFLSQNYPNPFNPSTVISWQLPVRSHVLLKVYDILGNEVSILVDEERPAGSYKVNFNANGLSSGIYFYRLQAGSFVQSKKMLLIK